MRQQIDLGSASVDPALPIVAGTYATLRFVYTAGHPIDDTGFVKIVFRFAGDFGSPQFEDPTEPNYCSVLTTGDCWIEPRFDPKGHTRPWGRALYLKVMGGFLAQGEQIVVLFGDPSGGSPGWQMQTFCERSFEFRTLVDPIATFEFKQLPESPTLRVVAGDPIRAVCIAPSQVVAGEGFPYWLKLEDRWGNPTGRPERLTHPGFDTPGAYTVAAKDPATSLAAQSNPICALREHPPLSRYWADLHGQSEETIGSNTIEDYFTFARDYGLLDIASHQGNDFQVTDDLWALVNETTRQLHEPGAFITFPGYEWSGNTPLGGDRNIYFASEGGRIVHSSADLLPGKRSAYPIAATAKTLFAHLSGQAGPRPFAFAHVGGRYADVSMHDPGIEWAVEVHSAWGTFEWLVEDALERGYRVGICANSDGHKGRPGASYPGASKFGSYGGLTCVLASKLEREGIVGALAARHFYATTGARMLLDVSVKVLGAQDAMMGDVIQVSSETPIVLVQATGTGPIENIEVRNGLQRIATLRTYDEEALGSRIKVVWSGSQVRGRARLVSWDGGLWVRGNALLNVVPINFWNPDRQPIVDGDRVTWRSITTGGVAGLCLTLEEPLRGSLYVHTDQQDLDCDIASIGLEPRQWECGGVRKQIALYRLPDRPSSSEFSFSLPLTDLGASDNPIYVRVTQEDGHMAWSSPVYVVRRDRHDQPRL